MSKSIRNLGTVTALAAGCMVLIAWLQSSPNCDRGCRTQLEHLKDHLLVSLFQILLSQFGL